MPITARTYIVPAKRMGFFREIVSDYDGKIVKISSRLLDKLFRVYVVRVPAEKNKHRYIVDTFTGEKWRQPSKYPHDPFWHWNKRA